MTIRMSKRVAASFNRTLTLPFRTANTSNWLQFYIGPVPDNATLANLTTLSSLSASKTGDLVSNAGAVFGYSSTSAENPLYYAATLPTSKTFSATQTGTITHAAVTGDGWFIIVSVSALNGGGVIQVNDPVIATIGQSVTLQAIQFKVWR